MRKIVSILIAAVFFSIPVIAFAEGPMNLPDGASADAKMHNKAGIKHYGMGHYDVALGHFQESAAIDASNGEIHFNEAISLDKLGKHGDATKHFGVARKKAGGNKAILESKILNAHLGM
jgi:Flp pilus assembly protein TadD